MSVLVKQNTAAPTRKIKIGMLAAIPAVPAAEPITSVLLGVVNAVSPDLYSALIAVTGFQSGLSSLIALSIAYGVSYMVKDNA